MSGIVVDTSHRTILLQVVPAEEDEGSTGDSLGHSRHRTATGPGRMNSSFFVKHHEYEKKGSKFDVKDNTNT